MSAMHNHAAMGVNTTPNLHHDHPMETNQISTGQGLRMSMMAMTFHGGHTETILFDQWSTQTVMGFTASWFFVFAIAIFYEALKTLRDMLAQRDICSTCSQRHTHASGLSDEQQYDRTSSNDLIPATRIENRQMKRARLLSLPHMIQTLLHIVQMTLSYLLMLIAMTFNTYLFLAIIFGAGFGHFLFGWRRSSVLDHNEHCH